MLKKSNSGRCRFDNPECREGLSVDHQGFRGRQSWRDRQARESRNRRAQVGAARRRRLGPGARHLFHVGRARAWRRIRQVRPRRCRWTNTTRSTNGTTNSSLRRSRSPSNIPGGSYGLPFTFRGEALYYNKALFQKAGITERAEDLRRVARGRRQARQSRNPGLHFRRNRQLARHAADGRNPGGQMRP